MRATRNLTRVLDLMQATREPTVTSIPRILVRAVMRTLARVVLLLAGAVLALAVLLLIVSVFLATWPSVHRRS